MTDMSMMKRIYEEVMADPEMSELYKTTLGMRDEDATVVMDQLIEAAYARLYAREPF
jgi:hypothetical protein